jgi:hypothetical protein
MKRLKKLLKNVQDKFSVFKRKTWISMAHTKTKSGQDPGRNI